MIPAYLCKDCNQRSSKYPSHNPCPWCGGEVVSIFIDNTDWGKFEYEDATKVYRLHSDNGTTKEYRNDDQK